jgi:hypothetical protein
MAKGGAAAAMRAVAKKAKSFPREFVDQAATDLRKAATQSLKADTGDGGLSRAGNQKLKVTRKVKGSGALVIGEVSAGSPRAQWFWLEEGTRPHMIGRRRHPGARPKRTWSIAIGPAVNKAQRDAQTRLRTIVRG